MAKNDFFLEPDDAQTFGDINFMRKSVRVKRTFPKTKKNQSGFAVEKEISSLEARKPSSNGYQSIPDYLKPESGSTQSQNNGSSMGMNGNGKSADLTNPEERRRTDTSMDMFLNMARSIKKR
jgi:hypothetical protein